MNNNFQYSCIGDNTPENREHLEKLGYKMQFVVSFVDFELIYTWKGRFYFIDKSDLRGLEMSLFINCINNHDLFQAVTAMRTDSDYLQWFVWDVNIFTKDYDDLILERGSFELSDEKDFIGIYDDYPREAHKATLAELQEHFK